MSRPDESINPRILEAAKAEFLACGYEAASTNVICKNAGVTTGALYKRYAGKDELFCALVSPVADEFKSFLEQAQSDFHHKPPEEQANAVITAEENGAFFLNYVYAHFEEFKLLINCSKGSSYEGYMDLLADILVQSTERYINNCGHEVQICGTRVTHETIHILVSSYLYGLFEPVSHNMSFIEAKIYAQQLKHFFDVGWADILLPKNEMP